MRKKRTSPWVGAVLTSFLLGLPAVGHALPQGGKVAGGQANIAAAAGNMDITQSSHRAILNWQSFDINGGERVGFTQPSQQSVALNRVTGGGAASQILGRLDANGTVMLVNPQGVVMGRGAQVNVGGLVATSSDIDNDRFMSGDYRFDRPGHPEAVIENAGEINVREGGLAALAGPNVRNSGVIRAKLGKVQMASGDTFTVDLYGDGLIQLQASEQLKEQLVRNSGTIEADGGQVLLTAAAAQDTIKSLINMDGLIQANSVGNKNGQVVLYAEGRNAVRGNKMADKGKKNGASTVLVSGKIETKGEKGGTVDVLGDHVGILSGATIDASGAHGGGTIKVGGDYYGKGDTPTASYTIMQSGSKLSANATQNGDGGKVTLWADGTTLFDGKIEAKGGAAGGNGGFVETSGREILQAYGNVDASALLGKGGLWLLDPNNITINNSANANNIGDPNFTSTANNSVVNAGSIVTNLNAGTNVTITTGTGGTNSQDGNIVVAQDIAKTTGTDANLTLNAHNDISFNANANVTSTSNKLHVTLNSDSDNSGAGNISMAGGSSVETNGGDIIFGGGGNPANLPARGQAGGVFGIDINNAILNAAGGNISLRGLGSTPTASNTFGVRIRGGAVVQTSGTGNISINGTGGGTANNNLGIQITGAGSTVTAQNGNITLTGSGGAVGGTGTGNIGIALNSGSIVGSTGSGAITLTGTPGGNGLPANNNIGIEVATGTNTVGGASATGQINFVTDTLSVSNTFVPRTMGNITFQPVTAGTTIGIGGASGTLQLTSAILNTVNAGSLTIGSSLGTGTLTANAHSWTAPASLLTGSGGIVINGVQTMGARSFLAQTTSGNITLGASGGVNSTAPNTAITLAASGGNFINNNGASALSAGSGRWLIYSANPLNDTLGGVSSAFHRYSCAYGGSCPSFPATGNGNLYSFTPFLTATPTGLSLIYGDATPALMEYGYALNGYLGSDLASDLITGALNGSTTYVQGSNIGNYNINHASGALASSLGYGFTYANNATAITVNQKTLTVALTGTVSKIYDALTNATLAAGNYFISGIFGSDVIGIANASGSYDTKDVGTGKTVTVNSLGLTGVKAGNYTLASSSVNGAVGVITPHDLSITANDKTMTYGDGNSFNGFTPSGLQGGETVGSVNLATNAGTSTSGNWIAGLWDITASNASGGTFSASNYNISYAPGALNVGQKSLTVSATGVNRVYDATTDVTVTLSDNKIGGDVVADTYTSASFTNKNVGTGKTVNVSGIGISGADAGNYQLAGTTASTTANVTPRDLTVSAQGVNRAYDATVNATVNLSDDKISGDDVTNNYASASFANKNAGTGKAVNVSGIGLGGSDAGNYNLLNTTANTAADITPHDLDISANDKNMTYGDGNSFSGFAVDGLQGGETLDSVDLATNATLSGSGNWRAGAWDIMTSNASGGTFDPANYTIAYDAGTLDISPKEVSVAAHDHTISFGEGLPFLTYAHGLLQSGDDSSLFTGGLSVANGLASGSFTIIQGTLSAGPDYLITFTPGTLTVEDAPFAAINSSSVQGNTRPQQDSGSSGQSQGGPLLAMSEESSPLLATEDVAPENSDPATSGAECTEDNPC